MDIACHLFDTCISPILLYGCEVWGFTNLKEIETVQTSFYKYLLNLNKGTASCIVLGEVGRVKLEEIIKQRVCNFWARLRLGKDTKIAALMYKILRNFSDNGTYKSRWITFVETTLNQSGLGYIWLTDNPQTRLWFKGTLNRRISDIYLQKWSEDISNSGHCRTYKILKSNLKLEDYLLKLDKNRATKLCKFRAGNTKLPIVIGRYRRVDRQARLRHLCDKNEIGDEFHYIMSCPALHNARSKLIKCHYWQHPNEIKLKDLFSSQNVNTLKNLVSFIDVINKSLDPLTQTYFKSQTC